MKKMIDPMPKKRVEAMPEEVVEIEQCTEVSPEEPAKELSQEETCVHNNPNLSHRCNALVAKICRERKCPFYKSKEEDSVDKKTRQVTRNPRAKKQEEA